MKEIDRNDKILELAMVVAAISDLLESDLRCAAELPFYFQFSERVIAETRCGLGFGFRRSFWVG